MDETSLAAVIGSLVDAARLDARRHTDDASREAATLIAEAEARRARLLDDARQSGLRAAATVASARQADVRRRAREVVLAERRRVLEALRSEAVGRLGAQIHSPAGSALLRRLAADVEAAVGAPAVERFDVPDGWGVSAESSSRRAEVGPAWMVDRLIQEMSAEVESLWR